MNQTGCAERHTMCYICNLYGFVYPLPLEYQRLSAVGNAALSGQPLSSTTVTSHMIHSSPNFDMIILTLFDLLTHILQSSTCILLLVISSYSSCSFPNIMTSRPTLRSYPEGSMPYGKLKVRQRVEVSHHASSSSSRSID